MFNNKSKTQLTKSSLIAYGGLALPLSIAELPIILYLPAFYAKEVGLSIGMVGLVFLFARLWDGISDPIIGTLSDRTTSGFGRRKPWVAIGAPLLMGAAWFLCNPPEGVGLSYLFFGAILFYTAQTIIKIPYWSWGAELSSDYEERNWVTGFREGSAMIGNLVVASAPLLLLPKDAPVRDVLFLISVLLIVLIPITATPLITAISDNNPITRSKFEIVKIINELSKNIPLRRFLVSIGCLFIGSGVINSIAIFLIDIGFGLPGSFFSLFLIEYVTAILAAPFVVKLANRIGKHVVLIMVFALFLLTNAIGFMLPMSSYSLATVWICIMGVVFSGLYILPTSILADIIDYDAALFGEERAGIYMASLNLLMKLGLALGVGIAYGFLDVVGFDPTAAVHTAYDVKVIKIAFFGITSVLLIPAILFLWKFPITKSVQRKLRQQIETNSNRSQQGSDNSDATPSVTNLVPDNG